MEFLKNHKKITSEETEKIQLFLIENFKRLKEEGRSKEYAIDICCSLIYKEFIEANFIGKYSSHFESVYTIFQNAFDNYDRNDKNIDVITQILKNEIYEEFQHFGNINKISNRHYDDDFDSITFEDFVIYLLKYHVAKKAKNNLNRNSELYYIFYDTNDYSKFTLRHFDGHVINSDFYRKIFAEFYPNKPIPIATKQKNGWGNVTYVINYNPPQTEEEKITEIKEKLKKPYFELDEKLLLLHYCLIDKYGIPLTEKAKLIVLLGQIEDSDLFDKSSDSSNSYKKISLGYDRPGSKINTQILIEKIINKLNSKHFHITQQTLKKHSSKLNSE